ncbi:YraN family protein [Rhodobacteraceae bacterium LMO-12]|nr:YraN family protein [Rhodobacteraceae bacterium LMO-JJ12]
MTAHFPVAKSHGSAVATRRVRGKRAYCAGLAAEEQVAQEYARRGMTQVQQRWRGQRGEIDLVMRDGEALVFVEVKQSSSFERAAESLTARQMARIYGAAEEYLSHMDQGQLSETRFDVALVDGRGVIRIIENAFGAF